MLVSHEVPISMLEESRKFNDYDYCLLHLTYEHEDYRQFYKDSIKMGREVLLDNSLFELGDALTLEAVADGVRDLNPTWVVVPDCLNDAQTTIDRFKEWEEKYSDLGVKTIGVAQGNTMEELTRCYKFMAEHADKIAIPFDSEAFFSLCKDGDTLERWCRGRQEFVMQLVDEKVWCDEKPHHLLGCSYAKEFECSSYVGRIDTVDTSNPVVAAIKGLKYGVHGLAEKPSIKLCELIDYKPSDYEKKLITYNTCMFKYICGREKKWLTYFSRTGSEINNLIDKLGVFPFVVFTNREDLSSLPESVAMCEIIQLPNKPTEQDYIEQLLEVDAAGSNVVATLHGYLRIIPETVCKAVSMYNLHPGLVSKYPKLKGFNPQEKAYNMGLETSGVMIHRVIPEVDAGEILMEKEVSIESLTLDEIYNILHVEATELWVKFFKEELNFYA